MCKAVRAAADEANATNAAATAPARSTGPKAAKYKPAAHARIARAAAYLTRGTAAPRDPRGRDGGLPVTA